MPTTPAHLINLYGFAPSRRVFALTEVERRAQQRGLPMIVAHVLVALDHDRSILQRALVHDADGTRGLYGPEATEVDNLLDHCINGFHGHLGAQIRIFLGLDRGQSAEVLRNAAFPSGPGAITRLPYAQQHAQVDAMLDRLEDPELAPHRAALPEVTELLERIRELNTEYGQVLHAYPPRISGAELRTVNARGQDLLAEVVAMILAHFAVLERDDPKAAAEGREHMLEPIMRQNEAIRLGRQRRRRPRGIDPATGEESPGSDVEPGGEPEVDAGGDIEPGAESDAGAAGGPEFELDGDFEAEPGAAT